MLDFLFSPVMNLFVGILAGVVITALMADFYYKDKVYKERARRVSAEEKAEVLRTRLENAQSEVYLSRRKRTEKMYMDRFTAYGKEINRKPMVFETVEHDGKIVACTGRLN